MTAVSLWATAIAAAAAAVWLPYRLPPPDRDANPAVVTVAPPATAPALAAALVDDVAGLSLRRPLVDPPPVPATGPVVLGAGLRLTGIVAEPGHSYAVLVTATGATEVRAVGQRTDTGAEVVAIGPAAVTLRVAGQLTTLRLPPPTPPISLP